MWTKFLQYTGKAAVVLLITSWAMFQEPIPVARILTPTTQFTTDHLGNVYAIHHNNIRKYDAAGLLLAEFSMKRFDRINSADPADPMKILLFCKSSAETIRLDNKLAVQGEPLSLYDAGLITPELVCSSYENGMWVFDRSLNELVRINPTGLIDQRSANLNEIAIPNLNFATILESDFLLYASSPAHGILVFDRYANYLRTIPITGIETLQVVSGKIFYTEASQLITFDTKTLEKTRIPLPEKNCKHAMIQGNLLFLHHTDTISIYLTKQPL
jgi:hypothetical protein